MRKYLFTLLIAAFLPLAGGHVLTKLWQNFDSALKADKPQDEMKALDAIKKEAKSKHLTWDYYDACTRYVDVASSVNWKLRDSLAAKCEKEIFDFGEPVAEYYLNYVRPLSYKPGRVNAIEFAKSNKKKLSAGKHPDFYGADWSLTNHEFGEWLRDNLANDYEYVLWSIGDKDALKEQFAGKYPMGALVEYIEIADLIGGLKAFVAKYDGKAAAVFAEARILQLRLEELEKNLKVRDDTPYKALYEECKALSAKRKAFKDNEKSLAMCCTRTDALSEQLTAPSLDVSVVDGEAFVVLRNLTEVRIEIAGQAGNDEKKVELWKSKLENKQKSFYLPDTVKVNLPILNDGEYQLKCSSGKLEDLATWQKYTIAASLRYNADGPAVWAADYLSGEPIAKVDIELVRNKEVVKRFEGISLDGYTPLPEELISLAGKGKKHDLHYVRLLCAGENGVLRSSRTMALRPNYKAGINDDPTLRHCQIFTDRRAYNPGETLRFKAIVYYGKYSYTKASKGEKYRAVLKDTEGNVLGSLDKTTGEFGGFGGPFVLTRTQKNGWYRLYIEDEAHQTVASTSVLVDDFVLPTFDVVFDKQPEQWLPLDKICVSGKAAAYSGHSLAGADATWSYTLNGEEKDMGKAGIKADGSFCLEIPAPSEYDYIWYSVRLKLSDASGETHEFSTGGSVCKKPEIKAPTEYYFEDLGGDNLALKVVAGSKPVWMVYEVHGSGDVLLAKGLQEIAGQAGNDEKGAQALSVMPDPIGHLATTELRLSYDPSWPDAVSLNVIYFQNKKCYSRSISRRRHTERWDLPLEFTRFLDTTMPGQQYSFGIKTGPDAECTAVIFDKATERFAPNAWHQLLPSPAPLPSVRYTNEAGSNDSRLIVLYSVRTMAKSTAGINSLAAVAEEAVAMDSAPAATQSQEAEVLIREDFATTIAWVPALISDKDGNIEFKFTNADKLSTFWVQLFAHDKTMRSASLRREMKVTLPVKVSLAQPQFLYEGDRYIARIALANSTENEVRGALSIDFFDGDYRSGKLLQSVSRSISVTANGNASSDEAFEVPAGVKSLGIKATFRPEIADQVGNDGKTGGNDGKTVGHDGKGAADAIFVAVPILPPYQTITEAHSALLLAGADRATTEKALRDAFVNIPGSEATLKEISILDMIKEAVPEELEARCDNAISLAKALQAYSICKKLGQNPKFDEAATKAKLLACKAEDGGYAWFAGMESSLQVTAFVLESLDGLGIIDETAALQYIDNAYFNRGESLKRAWWYRGISMEEYLHLRSLYPGIPFKAKTDASFRKAARKYLTPKKERGLNGAILAKARRMQTLKNLSASDEGLALAKKMGVKLAAKKKIRRSLKADLASLLQYSQPHRHGGIYYPNAVMPWRGLMGSELYAHTLICKLLEACGKSDTADGIRLWIMLQKETQHWESDPAFVGAIACVMDASPAVLDTRVMALSGSFTKPFAEIKAAGNGMGIGEMPDQVGHDVKKVGDKVTLSWELSSEENRSFVKVSLPVPAGLQPVNQMSGWNWGYYRNVTPGCIERWYECYPEEKIIVSEDFYVVRAGSFQASVPVIECLYAPHYRANGVARNYEFAL